MVPACAHESKYFCANFVPLAYKIRPYKGICGNSNEPSSYWYYYPCLLLSIPVYLLWKTSNLNVGSSSLSACTSSSTDYTNLLFYKSYNCATFVPLAYKNRPYLGICGNSKELASYWYYYPCLLQSFPVYLLWQTSDLMVGGSTPPVRTRKINWRDYCIFK